MPYLRLMKFILLLLTLCLLSFRAASAQRPFQLEHGDHIVLIGNTLAERMQHDGWFETLLHNRFPQHELTLRNLSFSADAVTRWFGDEPPPRLRDADQVSEGVTTRLRSEAFGSSDEWLRLQQTDVIFAFFGFSESFAGLEGVDRFKKAMSRFVKHTLGQQYNGTTSPQLVLFSPIAHENLHDPNLPDGEENNRRDRKSTRLNSSHTDISRMPSSA